MAAGRAYGLGMAGRALGPDTLLTQGPYRPSFTWAQLMATTTHFLGDIMGRGDWPVWGVALLWAALFAAAWSARSRVLKFAWFFVTLSPIPVAFVARRGAQQYYVAWFGWVLYAAVALVKPVEYVTGKIWSDSPRVSRVRGAVLIAALLLILYPYAKRAGWDNVTSASLEAPDNRHTVEELHAAAPRIRTKSRLLFLNDPIVPEWENLVFIVRLSYGDPTLEVDRVKKMKQMPDERQLASYDYILDYQDSRFSVVKQP